MKNELRRFWEQGIIWRILIAVLAIIYLAIMVGYCWKPIATYIFDVMGARMLNGEVDAVVEELARMSDFGYMLAKNDISTGGCKKNIAIILGNWVFVAGSIVIIVGYIKSLFTKKNFSEGKFAKAGLTSRFDVKNKFSNLLTKFNQFKEKFLGIVLFENKDKVEIKIEEKDEDEDEAEDKKEPNVGDENAEIEYSIDDIMLELNL